MIALDWIRQASVSLKGSGIETARLDAMVLLEYITKVPREEQLAHMDKAINWRSLRKLQKALKKRQHHYPVAYITGQKDFYGLMFKVTQDVLIPRPETESLVELAVKYAPKRARLLDMGTGSGCIALSIARTRPDLAITASDNSQKALYVAQQNANNLGLDVVFIKSNLFKSIRTKYDVITANLPYVPDTAKTSPETAFEPFNALFGGNDGLDIYRAFFSQVDNYIAQRGLIILEAEPNQHSELKKIAHSHGFLRCASSNFALVCRKSNLNS